MWRVGSEMPLDVSHSLSGHGLLNGHQEAFATCRLAAAALKAGCYAKK